MNNKEKGRKGGLAKAEKYKQLIKDVISLFVNSGLSQQEIANKLNVSQAFVSKHTSNKEIRIQRLRNHNV